MKLDDPKFKKNIYQVPDAYFDHLSGHIMQRVESPESSANVRWFILPAVRFSMAAAVVVLLALSGWFYQENTAAAEDELYASALLEEVSDAEIENFLMYTDLSSIEVAEIIQEENLEVDFSGSDNSIEDQLLELDLEFTDFEEVL